VFCSNPSGVRRTKVLILQNTFKFYLLLLLAFQIILFVRLISSKVSWNINVLRNPTTNYLLITKYF